jgi:hypothetical protein
MKTLDEKLAKLSSLSGKDPYVVTPSGFIEVICTNVSCKECLFRRENTTLCAAYTTIGNTPISSLKVRSYKDAITLYPELFL